MRQKLKNIITNLCYIIFNSKNENIDLKINDADIVSFDIFDTLIKRNVKHPTDVFSLIERQYNNFSNKKIVGFKENRIESEKLARTNSTLEEVTLEEIYSYMDYNKDEKKSLLELEIQIEKDICIKNNAIYDIYKKCLDCGKKIFFTSDMYLPKKVVEDILIENGYSKYDKLYLSSDKKLSKSSGNLFREIIKDSNTQNKKILHIGDNPKGDFFIPRRYGIKTILINRNTKNTIFQSTNDKSLDYNILSTFINNSLNNINLSYYEQFGYEVLGPILYSFTTWIHEKIVENKIEKIYFLARDAKIIMEVYKERFGNEIPIYYLNVSRKSVLKATIGNIKNFDELYFKIKSIVSVTSTMNDLLKVLSLEKTHYTKEFKKFDLQSDKLISNLSQDEKNNLFHIICDDILKQYKEQNNFLKQYLKQNDMCGKVALVDIGWLGTIQYYLDSVISNKTELNGYYYGISTDSKYTEYKNLKREGYLFDSKQLSDCQSAIQLSVGIFETMFLSSEGSTLAYKKEGDLIKPVYGDEDCSRENIIFVSHIQKQAKRFVKDFSSSRINKYPICDAKAYFENYNFFATKPTNRKMNLFKNFEFNDINNKKMIERRNVLYYIFHPKRLYIDFRNSRCKIMFVKAIFKVNVPYYRILKKMYNKQKNQ